MAPLIVFVHIPKTGGTSIRVAAEHYFGHKRMLYDYGPKARLTSKLVKKWIYRKEDLDGFANAVSEGKYSFLSGHFPVTKYQSALHSAAFVSWLRDPFSRLWSAYHHYSQHLGFKGTFSDFYSGPRFSNQQSRLLNNNLDKVDFVGVTEHFQQSLRQLNNQFGVNFVQYKANKTQSSSTYSPQQEDLDAIREMNLKDNAIYQQATLRILENVKLSQDTTRS